MDRGHASYVIRGVPSPSQYRSRFCLIPSGQFGSFCFLAGSTDLTADRGASSCHLDRVAAAHQSGSVFSGWIVIRTTFASWLLSVFLSAVDRHYTYILPRPEASHWVQRFLGPSDWVLHVSSIRLGRVPFGGGGLNMRLPDQRRTARARSWLSWLSRYVYVHSVSIFLPEKCREVACRVSLIFLDEISDDLEASNSIRARE